MPRAKKNDKRERLIQAADKLIYEQTFHTTTLADIAKLAEVPLGNVYYYFKTKEAIMDAVLQTRMQEWRELFQQWEQIPEVKDRLIALLHYNTDQSETLARFGCAIGSLCQELGKQGGILANTASKLMSDILKWVETQFEALGKGDRAPQLATYFLAGIQGMNLLTLTFKEPKFMERQSETLTNWLKAV